MIRELKTFVAVTRYGTLAATAMRIGLTQSAVSAQIRRLETELGFDLFDRSGRSSRLTNAGQHTLERARELLALYAGLVGTKVASEETGTVCIGAIASFQASELIDALVQFRIDLPGWKVRVVPGVSLNMLSQVDAGELDMAVMIQPPFAIPAELSWTPLKSEPLVLLVPEALADQNWEELVQSQPFIRYDRNSFGGRTVDRFLRGTRLAVAETFELDELHAISNLVASGAGVAIVPWTRADDYPKGVVPLPLAEATFREIGLIERAGETKHRGARTLARLVVQSARR